MKDVVEAERPEAAEAARLKEDDPAVNRDEAEDSNALVKDPSPPSTSAPLLAVFAAE